MKPMDNLPFITIVIPCYNEEKNINRCLDSIISNDYPQSNLEVLVVDGMSNDGTREIIDEYHYKHPFIHLVNNLKRYTPYAMNEGIKIAKGDIIMIMGCHADYPTDYISQCRFYLKKLKADNVGGVMLTKSMGNGIISKSIAAALSSPFGMGNSHFRTGAKAIREVDTVFGGCYPKTVFDKIGLFNERLIRGQDREFNLRLKKNGGKIFLIPSIECAYYARANLSSHLKHMYSSGYVIFQIIKVTGSLILSWRNIAPIAFVISLAIFSILSFYHVIFRGLFAIEMITYIICAVIAANTFAKNENNFRYFFSIPFIFFLTHIVYGMGSFISLFKQAKAPVEQ